MKIDFISKIVFPSDFRNFSKVTGLQKEEKSDLKGISFISYYPSNLNPLIKIVVVYGIMDYREDIAPDANY